MKEFFKSIIGLLFVLLVISPYVIKSIVLIDFYVHQEEIKSQLCVERFVEESCCQGHCVLQKQLQNTEGHTAQWPQILKEKIEAIYDLQNHEPMALGGLNPQLNHYAQYQPLSSQESLPCIAHPPCC
jgi:hypothetical protein